MTPKTNRQIAEDLEREITDCMNSDVAHCYKPGNERCDIQNHLEEALNEAEERGFEKGIKGAAYLMSSLHEYLMEERILSLLSSRRIQTREGD